MAKMNHSDKALATLSLLGTAPSDWTLTEIEWREEERMVVGQVKCPECMGWRWVRYDDAGAPIACADERTRFDYENLARREARAAGFGGYYGNCKRCRGTRGRMLGIPSGKVAGMVKAKVMVGYPKFPKGTRFESRFAGGGHCELCNKAIKASGRVPVNTTGENPRGMWVGEDCARKFLAVTIKRAADSVMEDAQAA